MASASRPVDRFFREPSSPPSPPLRLVCPTKSSPRSEWEDFYRAITLLPQVGIPPSDRLRLFDPEEIFEFWTFLAESAGEGVERVRETFRRLLEQEIPENPADLFTVPLVPAPEFSAVADLGLEFPHFARAGVIECLEESVILSRAGDGTLSFPPLLLLGDPGVGKTRFFQRLAKAFNVPSQARIDCAVATAGWILSGTSSTWANAKPGEIFALLTTYRHGLGNPLIFLDELDKARENRESSPLHTLYTLLEPEGARQFRDEFCPIRIDASRLLWVAAGNDLSGIPDPILSRFRVFTVPSPTPGEKRQIAARIWEELRTSPWGSHFDPILPGEVVEPLLDLAPREIRARLLSGAARALKRQGIPEPNDEEGLRLSVDDVHLQAGLPPRKGMGFRA
ncbi:MAG: AAA family ATPase [Nitrospiraceae bacterium]|nr:AAA family ATPase [Nitrospiraceae bacterium]